MVYGFRNFSPSASTGHRRSCGFTLMELLVVIVIIAALAAMVVSQVDSTRDQAELTVARADLQAVSEAIFGSAVGKGYLRDMKYVPGFRSVNLRPHDLFSPSSYPAQPSYDAVANRGWRGPYLRKSSGVANTHLSLKGLFPASSDRRFTGDPTFLERGFYANAASSNYGFAGDFPVADPWGNPIVIQVPPLMAFSGAADDAKRFLYVRLVSAGPDGALTTPPDRLAGMLADGSQAARGDDLVLFPNRADVYETE